MRKAFIQPLINWDWYLICDEKDDGVEVISFDRRHRYEERGCCRPFKIDGELVCNSEGENRKLLAITVREGGIIKTHKVLNPKNIFSYTEK